MVSENLDPYRILGVSPTATRSEITHAFRSRLRAHHPDTRQEPYPHIADEQLRQVLAAYALLRDPVRRTDYDRVSAADVTQPHIGPTGPTSVVHHPAGRVEIPITYRSTKPRAVDVPTPLQVGPVRQHR